MATAEKCSFDGVEYSEGGLICSNGMELKCSGGEWQPTGYACEALERDNSGYVRVSPDGLRVEEARTGAVRGADCVLFIIGAPVGHVRLYNSCDTCKIATVAWTNGAIENHRVEAGGHKDIRYRSNTGQIVGEKACPSK